MFCCWKRNKVASIEQSGSEDDDANRIPLTKKQQELHNGKMECPDCSSNKSSSTVPAVTSEGSGRLGDCVDGPNDSEQENIQNESKDRSGNPGHTHDPEGIGSDVGEEGKGSMKDTQMFEADENISLKSQTSTENDSDTNADNFVNIEQAPSPTAIEDDENIFSEPGVENSQIRNENGSAAKTGIVDEDEQIQPSNSGGNFANISKEHGVENSPVRNENDSTSIETPLCEDKQRPHFQAINDDENQQTNTENHFATDDITSEQNSHSKIGQGDQNVLDDDLIEDENPGVDGEKNKSESEHASPHVDEGGSSRVNEEDVDNTRNRVKSEELNYVMQVKPASEIFSNGDERNNVVAAGIGQNYSHKEGLTDVEGKTFPLEESFSKSEETALNVDNRSDTKADIDSGILVKSTESMEGLKEEENYTENVIHQNAEAGALADGVSEQGSVCAEAGALADVVSEQGSVCAEAGALVDVVSEQGSVCAEAGALADVVSEQGSVCAEAGALADGVSEQGSVCAEAGALADGVSEQGSVCAEAGALADGVSEQGSVCGLQTVHGSNSSVRGSVRVLSDGSNKSEDDKQTEINGMISPAHQVEQAPKAMYTHVVAIDIGRAYSSYCYCKYTANKDINFLSDDIVINKTEDTGVHKTPSIVQFSDEGKIVNFGHFVDAGEKSDDEIEKEEELSEKNEELFEKEKELRVKEKELSEKEEAQSKKDEEPSEKEEELCGEKEEPCEKEGDKSEQKEENTTRLCAAHSLNFTKRELDDIWVLLDDNGKPTKVNSTDVFLYILKHYRDNFNHFRQRELVKNGEMSALWVVTVPDDLYHLVEDSLKQQQFLPNSQVELLRQRDALLQYHNIHKRADSQDLCVFHLHASAMDVSIFNEVDGIGGTDQGNTPRMMLENFLLEKCGGNVIELLKSQQHYYRWLLNIEKRFGCWSKKDLSIKSTYDHAISDCFIEAGVNEIKSVPKEFAARVIQRIATPYSTFAEGANVDKKKVLVYCSGGLLSSKALRDCLLEQLVKNDITRVEFSPEPLLCTLKGALNYGVKSISK